VDDFLIIPGRDSMHVCNAPSPAATASIAIGRYIVERIPTSRKTRVALSA
jgi:L-2-hydroxyglutarate oxidase